ncbi:MATE family efflux transporter [Devosia sp. 1566]|uniref:MATE family efflux transporter n=1 Tax=Devosia sp. 1566 TaxID=2499144 RepID=UPI000FD90AD6|nr:MATE family efflux transporter [Devosia sp. 1566]
MSEQITVVANATAAPEPVRVSWIAELRATFALAWPLVIAQLAQNALATTDVIMLGWLGPSQLAAGTLATTFLMPFLVGGIGLVGAVAPLVAQARGARDTRSIRHIVRQGLWAAAILALVLTPIIWQIRPVFALLGQDPAATLLAEEYIHVAIWLLFPALGIVAFRSLLAAFDATRVVLLITVGGVVVNALANYGLIFGNWGLPRLELRGAALATLLTNIVMFTAMAIFVLRHRRFRRLHLLHRLWAADWKRLGQIFRVGTPIGITVLAEVGLFTASALLMGRLGTDEVAAHAIALQCASTAFMVPLGLGTAATVRVGHAFGRGDPIGIARSGWTAFGLGTGFMACSALVFLAFGPAIVTIFLDPDQPANHNALALAASFVAVAGLFQIVDGAQVVAAHALRGLSDTKIPMVVAIIGYWLVGMPVAYLLGFTFDMRGVGIWIGLAVGLGFVAVVLVARFAMRERLGLLRPR